jgi:hypothetical protein
VNARALDVEEAEMFEVTDDSGFLALVDPDSYARFVDEDWTLEQLVAHFTAEMHRQRLLIWGTGLEGMWRVEVSNGRTAYQAFREIVGPITVAEGRLLLTNYETLTMVATFRDAVLPEEHDKDLLVSLPAATYNCRVLQLFNPDEDSSALGDGPDFVVELLRDEPLSSPWEEIPWRDI